MSHLRRRLRAVLSLLAVTVLAGGCSSDSDGKPAIDVSAGGAAATVQPTLYCIEGHAQFAEDDARIAAMEVKPDTKVVIDVPDEVAEAGWTIQIWTVNDTGEGALPLEQIGNVDAGNAESYDGFTTSDAVPDRYFIIVALPEDPGCDAVGSAGIWTVLVSRVG